MLAYGASKAAVHQMVLSLAAPDSGLPKGCVVLGLAPTCAFVLFL
jgi:NAD(P)-dependent dehydrogenase (short-subunit alcohol dehydrogenase family)